jgi:hypothetical protein
MHHEGRLPMMPPTLVCMEELAAAPDVATLLSTPRRVRPVSPWVARAPGPDGDEIPVLRVDLDGVGGGDPHPTDPQPTDPPQTGPQQTGPPQTGPQQTGPQQTGPQASRA